jgi:RNA polymerase sigma factor (sigma-70 family)
MWSSEAWSSAADLYLLARSREGSDEAFAELWRRHLPAAHAVAARYNGAAQAEDVVAEAATRVLTLLKEGRGPDENFRAYFLSTVRSVAVDEGRRAMRAVPTAEDELHDLLGPVVARVAVAGFDPELVRAAFQDLSERDQRILWHTTVEGEAPRHVAPELGMSANAVSVRAMRAREALRVNYLETYAAQHLPRAETPECRWALSVLGAEVRGRLPKRARDRLSEHLDGCAPETELLTQMLAIQARFPALVVPLLFVAGMSAPGFLGGAALASLSGAAGGTGAAGGAGAADPALAEAGPAGGAPDGGEAVATAVSGGAGAPDGATPAAAQRGADLVGGLAARVTGVAAALLIAAGVLGASSSPSEVTARSGGPASGSTFDVTSPSTSDTPTSASATTTSVATTRATPIAGVTQVAVRQTRVATPATVARRSTQPAVSGGPSIDLRMISSDTPTRFSLRFSTSTGGDLRVSVANAPGGGRLTAENGAYACGSTSASSVSCTGRGGHILLAQSGFARPQEVVVTVTDARGATTTRTLSLG